MTILEIIGVIGGAALALVLSYFAGHKTSVSKSAEVQHTSEVDRDKLVKTATDRHEGEVLAVRKEAKELAGRPVSDVLVDLIHEGEVSR